jgi:hypothetical protein
LRRSRLSVDERRRILPFRYRIDCRLAKEHRPANGSTPVTIPFAATSADTTTLPWMLDCLATRGYAGRVEEISLGPLEDPGKPSEGGGAD